jgi:putative endonuclease
MQFWVYILRCGDGSYYTGHTDDLEKRLWQHREGKGSDWTRRRRPVELVWCDWAGTRYEALEFERRVKNWSVAKKEALIAGDWERVGYFAKPPHERALAPLLHAGSNKAPALTPHERPSTSLRTNDVGAGHDPKHRGGQQDSFVPSEVEGRTTGGRAAPRNHA